jgi:hypothetical protein
MFTIKGRRKSEYQLKSHTDCKSETKNETYKVQQAAAI